MARAALALWNTSQSLLNMLAAATPCRLAALLAGHFATHIEPFVR